MSQKVIFLDRDGVINIDNHYIAKVSEFVFFPQTIKALQILHALGYALVIVTNQSGIARGYFSEKDLTAIHHYMVTELARHQIKLMGIYYCPHHPKITGDCICRKPKAGMLLQAINEHDLDVKASYMVGDKLSDLVAGQQAGITQLVQITPQGNQCAIATQCFDSLYHFAIALAARA